MKTLFLAILPVFLVIACNNNETKEVPEGILPKEKMTQVLIDIHITEAAIALKGLPSDSARILYTIQKEKILNKHQVSMQIYDSSYAYYVHHPELLDEVYTSVVDSLSLREERKVVD